MTETTHTLVAGIGNPILRDDTVGLHTVAAVEKKAAGMTGVSFRQLFCGGFDLLTELASARRVFIIDCLCDGVTKPGDFRRIEIRKQDWNSGRRQSVGAGHGIDLASVLHAGEVCGYAMPDPVVVYGIGASDVTTFDEYPTAEVFPAIERVASMIFTEITQLSAIITKES